MGKKTFYCSWVRGTFTRSYGWGDFAAGIVGNGLNVASHFNPFWKPVFESIYWAIPIYAILGALTLRAFIVPYELWREQKDRADAISTEHIIFDVRSWDAIDVFKLHQAACLWAEKSPVENDDEALPHEALPVLERMKLALRRGELALNDDPNREKWKWAFNNPLLGALGVSESSQDASLRNMKVNREGLKNYAKRAKVNPKFLSD